MFLKYFCQPTLGFRVRFQRPPQVVFDLFDSGGRAAPTARHPVPMVPAVPVVQSLSFDFASLRAGAPFGMGIAPFQTFQPFQPFKSLHTV